jgi:hypothetical protein
MLSLSKAATPRPTVVRQFGLGRKSWFCRIFMWFLTRSMTSFAPNLHGTSGALPAL